jgi:ATP-binding cassette, sub-family E, member 1
MKKVTAIIDRDKCKPNVCGHECIKYDPLNRSGGEGFHIGESGKAEIAEEVVTEMHKVSAKMCPFSAIRIVNLPDELKQEPLHSYGLNQFRLYSLPRPSVGKVVGIIGINGIGKSTAIKILAGSLKPNIGRHREASYHELIDFFKGTETQGYIEQVHDGEIKVMYKPQQIDLIQKKAHGKVRDLLEHVDEKGKLDEICAQLDITAILDRDISAISGGEMQRVAIAATVLKKADFYIFDEPTSFLDIKQRLKLSTFIRSIADENTRVMVIEHDLIVLDYITDLVHVMFGENGAYGIVSGVKSAKEGINIFLSGFLREENIRFRDKEISFERTPEVEQGAKVTLCSWTNVKKKLDDFLVSASEGEIHKGEIVGVLGENGIGKTTFVKMLAGVVKPDQGEISTKVTVSYKPQYLDVNDELVMNVLQRAIQQHTHLLIEPLNLQPLFLRKMNQLSGGELQRVAIAQALSKDAELFLLDEPSAYLDVEQRLILSKVLKRFTQEQEATILVVDHDLLFLDYLSNRLLVLDGVPAERGKVHGPYSLEKGMNLFLQDVGITFRREKESGRPRANKVDSVLDRGQKKDGKYYYA